MKIALLGRPGSGKTRLANALIQSRGPEWVKVDRYVERLQKRTGWPFAHLSDYRHNLAVIFERWLEEEEMQLKGYHTITCGTIYETIIYTLAQEMRLFHWEDPRLQEQEKLIVSIMSRALGVLEARYFDYDALFYLPLEKDDDTWGMVVDQKIPEVLDAFHKSAIGLEVKSVKDRVDTVNVVIDNIIKMQETYAQAEIPEAE